MRAPLRRSAPRLARVVALALLALSLPACGRRRVHARRVPAGHFDASAIPPALAPYLEALSDLVTSEYIGAGAGRSYEYGVYRRLARRLDRDTALRLLAHPSPSVRAWIATFVVEHLPEDLERVLPMVHDEGSIRTQIGCVGRKMTVGRWIVGALREHRRRGALATLADDARVALSLRLDALSALGADEAEVVARAAPRLLLLGGDVSPALRALGRARAANAFAVAAPYLLVPDRSTRLSAIDALATSEHPDAAPRLLARSEDPEPEVRAQAILAYAANPRSDRAIARALLDRYPYPEHRGMRLRQLIEYGTEPALALLDAEAPDARRDAVVAIGRDPSPTQRAWLRRQLAALSPTPTDSMWTLASALMHVLANGAEPEDLRLARRFLASPVYGERAAAKTILLATADAHELSALLDDDDAAREAAERLFWLRAFDTIDAIRAAASRRSYLGRLAGLADDLARVRDGAPLRPSADDPPRVSVNVTTVDCPGIDLEGASAHGGWSLRSAYRDRLAREPGLQGDVILLLAIDASGRVRGEEIGSAPSQALAEVARFGSTSLEFRAGAPQVCVARVQFRIVP